MNLIPLLKAMADETRMKILVLLLHHAFCGRALAAKLGISAAAVSQHIKILRRVGLIAEEKKGYFMHYTVNREVLHTLAENFETLAKEKCEISSIEQVCCQKSEQRDAYIQKENGCSDKMKELCHGYHAKKKTL